MYTGPPTMPSPTEKNTDATPRKPLGLDDLSAHAERSDPINAAHQNGKPANGGLTRRFSPVDRGKRFVRFNWLKIMRLKTSAHNIALGAGIGMFVGFLPIIPLQSFLTILLAFIFRANKVAAFFFTFISNPVTMVPFYIMLYKVGDLIMPFDIVDFDPNSLSAETLDMRELLSQGGGIFVIMTLGGIVLGIPASILTYFLVLNAVLSYRKRRAARLMRKMHREHEEEGLH